MHNIFLKNCARFRLDIALSRLSRYLDIQARRILLLRLKPIWLDYCEIEPFISKNMITQIFQCKKINWDSNFQF